MLSHTDLKKGVQFIYQGQPWQILEAQQSKMAQRRPVVQSKIKNLIDGKVQQINFQQGDMFEEAELEKKNIKFIYSRPARGNASGEPGQMQYFFCEEKDPSKRFSFTKDQIGEEAKFLRPNEIVVGLLFKDEFINIILPIKVQIKVKETPPGIKGNTAQGGTKEAVLESGATIQVPLFVEQGDTIEINTETGTYVRRV